MYFWEYNSVQTIYFAMVDSNRSEVTGLGSNLTVQIVKPGTTAYLTLSGTKGEVGNGIYYYTNDAADANLAGSAILRITGSGAIQQNLPLQIGGGFAWTGDNARTLSPPSATVVSTVATTNIVSVYRGVTWVIALTVGDITDYEKIWFTVKDDEDAYDNQALAQVMLAEDGLNDGLLYLNKDVADDDSLGAITIDDSSDGDITITVDEAATRLLATGKNLHYDVKVLRDDGTVDMLLDGVEKLNILSDITRAYS